jgi:hypothetical protein
VLVRNPESSKPRKQDYLVGLKPEEKKHQGRLARSYEWFLELPVSVVLGAMWLTGVGLTSVGVLVIYLSWLALEGVVGG